eukprot:62707-Pyramimonas_sp.AAC.1
MAWEPHVDHATGAFSGAPYGATKRVSGAPKWTCGGRGTAGGPCHWGLRWSPPVGREACEECAEIDM